MVFVPTTRERLAAEPFIDGRRDIATGLAVTLPVAELLEAWKPADTEPNRFIFHVGFCGSTLLATLFEIPGHSFAYREPNILADLANRQRQGKDIVAILPLVLALLRRPWRAGEVNVCKPSNWVNSLILPIVEARPGIRAVTISMQPRDFLIAAFRGGRDRLAFLIQLAAHLAPSVPDAAGLWEQASEELADPLDRAARLTLLALRLQKRLFAAASVEPLLDFRDLTERPHEALVAAAAALGLPLSTEEVDRAIARHAGKHSKNPGATFSAEQRGHDDADVERHHRATFDRALAWADRHL